MYAQFKASSFSTYMLHEVGFESEMFKTSGIFRVFQSQIEHILTASQSGNCDIYVKWLYFDKITYLRTY